jgi:hypothetical protein
MSVVNLLDLAIFFIMKGQLIIAGTKFVHARRWFITLLSVLLDMVLFYSNMTSADEISGSCMTTINVYF